MKNATREKTVDNWPYGRLRTTATFEVESNKRGERVNRTTINPKNGRVSKPKSTTYFKKMAIVEMEDGKTSVIGLCKDFPMVSRLPGTLSTSESFFPGDEEFEQILRLLEIPEEFITKLCAS